MLETEYMHSLEDGSVVSPGWFGQIESFAGRVPLALKYDVKRSTN